MINMIRISWRMFSGDWVDEKAMQREFTVVVGVGVDVNVVVVLLGVVEPTTLRLQF